MLPSPHFFQLKSLQGKEPLFPATREFQQKYSRMKTLGSSEYQRIHLAFLIPPSLQERLPTLPRREGLFPKEGNSSYVYIRIQCLTSLVVKKLFFVGFPYSLSSQSQVLSPVISINEISMEL